MLSKYGKVSSMLSFRTAFSSLMSVFVYYLGGIRALLIAEFITSIIGILIVSVLPNIGIYKKRKICYREILNSLPLT